MLFYMLAALVIAADQLSKIVVRAVMELGQTIPVSRGLLQFTYYENSGAAFSSFQGLGRYFVLVALGLALAVLYYRRKGELRGTAMDVITGLLVGGALGNAIDRVIFNQVTDFIVLGKGGGSMNVADIAITLSALLIAIRLVFQKITPRSLNRG
ncbi:lipoprotein signal peptidase [Paenibacillus nasutitermitis]|uniref:Lipoprotein signal peptidase n=1 Tax=Paenibacillus nasutitermitis TaxID=1652958 RepID=A0A917DZA2_9BACL|nr:lipoprotein signal peptidase [Paenibacillus nasutitermitis]